MTIPDVSVSVGIGGDPTFDVGSIHQLSVELTNPTPQTWTYDVYATNEGVRAFDDVHLGQVTLDSGAGKTFTQNIQMYSMPLESGRVAIVVYVALEDWSKAFYFDPITLVGLPTELVEVLAFTCPVGIQQIATHPVTIWYAWCGPLYLRIRSNFATPKYMGFHIRAATETSPGVFYLGAYIAGNFKICAEGFTGCLPGEGVAAVLPGEAVVKDQWDYAPAAPDPNLRLSVGSKEPTHLCLQIGASDNFPASYEGVYEEYFPIDEVYLAPGAGVDIVWNE